MSLTTAEISRLKFELGYTILTTGAEPYIGITNLFDQIVAPNLPAGAATTSATAVTASATPAVVTIVLASATGFATGALVWVGADDNLESATIQNLSGTNMTVALSKAHSGTYPVYVDSGEGIVREILNKIKAVKSRLSAAVVSGAGSLKKIDEIEWHPATSAGTTVFANISNELMYWRDELASALGVVNMWRQKRAAGSSIAVY
jgi:hypothetical protein